MNESSFERQVLEELRREALEGWIIKDAPIWHFVDVIAASPSRNVFPIEIKGGSGYLDISTVVRFGSEVERAVSNNMLMEYVPLHEAPSDNPGAIGVKPILATSREMPRASLDYAARFQIYVLSSARLLDDSTSHRIDIERFVSTLVDELTVWDNRIKSAHEDQSSGLVAPMKEKEWFTIDI